MTIDIRDIIERLNNDERINFIGVAVTLHQTNGIDAAIAQLRDKNIIPRGFILLLAHSMTGRQLKREYFYNLDSDVEVYDYNDDAKKSGGVDPIKSRFIAYSSAGRNRTTRTIYIALPRVDYQWIYLIDHYVKNAEAIYILLDDGEGSYINRYKLYLHLEQLYKHKTANIALKTKVFLIAYYEKLLAKKLAAKDRLIDNRLFIRTGKKSIRNTGIAKYYDEIFTKISSTIPEEVKRRFENAVIINTQDLADSNMLDSTVDYDLYKEIVSKLSDKGIKTIIKLHPRELDRNRYDDLGCDVFKDISFSQESIIAATDEKPICVISFFSSTLLNIQGIFGVPAISLAKSLSKSSSITSVLKEILDEYIEIYDEMIYFPDGIDDSIEKICELCNGRH